MSDGYTPKARPTSGEFRAYIKDNVAMAVGILSIATILISLVLYVSSKASSAELAAMQRALMAHMDGVVAKAITAHESRNAHHGVAGMIQTYAMPKSEGIRMGVKLEAYDEARRRSSARFDRMESKIDDLLAGRKRRGKKE